jgi:hypothetical protein
VNWYDEKADNPPLARPGVPNCEMSQAVGPLRVARQHGPHWRTASGQPPTKSQLLRGFDVNKSLKQKTGATPGQCYRRPPGRGMGSSKHFRFVLQWRQPFLSVSLLKPFGQRVSAGIGHIAGWARHSRSAASAGVRAFPASILVEQRPIRFIL